jgi:hypothetical protein
MAVFGELDAELVGALLPDQHAAGYVSSAARLADRAIHRPAHGRLDGLPVGPQRFAAAGCL